MARPVVLKLGGELIEEPAHLKSAVDAIAAVRRSTPLVVVHGGGREIDAALKVAGIEKRQVDGLRITDDSTLDVAVSVLTGAVNTRLVAALNAAGVPAVGLTGADGRCGLAVRASAHRTVDGRTVDLGHVGNPSEESDVRLLETLLTAGFVPVIASIGVAQTGELLNINADTFAGHLAARLGARRLVIGGSTAGVLDDNGTTVPLLDADAIAGLFTAGTATAGMIAKLRACQHALGAGVGDVVIVDGRQRATIEAAAAGEIPADATHMVPTVPATIKKARMTAPVATT